MNIEESERKYRLLAENSIDCIWTLDSNLRFTYLSPSLEQLLGAKPEDWIGTKLSAHFSKTEFIKAGGKALAALKDFKNFKKVIFESRILNCDGEEVDVEITGKVAKDENGKLLGLQGTTRVITERKNAEKNLLKSIEEKNILLSEIHHRVKNNMQLILSLLEIQKSYMPDEFHQIIIEIIDRIRILADVHQDFYYSENVSEINMAEQIETIFSNLSNEFPNIVLELHIDDPLFNLDTAIPLGLLMNELFSNSFKTIDDKERREITVSITKDETGNIENITYGCDMSYEDITTAQMDFSLVILNAMSSQLNLSLTVEKDNPHIIYFRKL